MSERTLPGITDVTDFSGQRVLVRAGLDVPVKDGVVQDDYRLQQGLETIHYLREQEARVIVIGHIGRDPKETLRPVAAALSKFVPVHFTNEVLGAATKSCVADMQPGDVVMLENLRQHPGEKENDPEFTRELAALGDLYVDESFSVAHRAHASMVGVPILLPAYAGINFMRQYEVLQEAMLPKTPAIFLLGGAKFETKMPLVKKYLDIYDQVFVGGALANDIYKARGLKVGTSLVSDTDLTGHPILGRENLLVPVDVTVHSERGTRVCLPGDVAADESILDAGPETIAMLGEHISTAKTVLWNGPLGNYETGFNEYTLACARLIAAADAYSIVGGGDTVAAIQSLDLIDQFSFVSTAGGAMLTYLEKGTLPAIDVLLNQNHD